MSLTLHRASPAVPAAVLTLSALLLVTGCSGTAPGSVSQAPPSVTFAPDVSTTPGMPGMPGMGSGGMGSMSTPAASAPPGSTAPVGGTAVGITDFAFAPATLTVPVGATVTWTNHDAEPHTVAASDGSFHSPGMDTDATYTYTFTKAGTFDYICSIHPSMHGTVVVTK
jgi:plastocyanin